MANKKRRHMSYERKKQYVGLLFVLPWVIGLLYFFISPVIFSLINSFCQMDVTSGFYQFTYKGLYYYKSVLFIDQSTIQQIISSVGELFYNVPMILVFSLFIAVILNQEFRGRLIMRAIFFLPLITTGGVVMKIITGDGMAQSMMNGSGGSALFQVTSIEEMMLNSGIPIEITEFVFEFINNIFALIWKSGIQILLLLAGLQTVSGAMYEAASIEGATGWEIFWKITMPTLYPVLTLALVYTVIDSFIDTTNPVMNKIISSAQSLNFGASSALCWVYFTVVAVVVGVIFLIIRKFTAD